MEQLQMQRGRNAVANWILLGVGMLIIQVLLGGITRLTGSGLSITEWDVVTGSLPPLSQAAWEQAFQLYQQTPQYRLLNFNFTLADFQFIFFWEWFHRLWARLIGVVFVVGFIYLWRKKYLSSTLIKPLLILFCLGALQGAIGWIMVASGLTGDAVYVKPTKLAMHFIGAMVLIVYAYWVALSLKVKRASVIVHPKFKQLLFLIIGILVVQLVYGAFMAGHKAASAAPTWPTINQQWLPEGMFDHAPMALNWVDNKILIHFVHRGLAYLLAALTVYWFIRAAQYSTDSVFAKAAKWPLILLICQVLLGISAVLTATLIRPGAWGLFEWMAQIHQLVAMLFLLSWFHVYYLIRGSKVE